MPAKPYALKKIVFTLKVGAGTATAYECWATGYELSSSTDVIEYATLCPTGSGSVAGTTKHALKISGVHDWNTGSLGWLLVNSAGEVADFSITDSGITITGKCVLVSPSIGGQINQLSTFEVDLPLQGPPTVTADAASLPAVLTAPKATSTGTQTDK